MDFWLLPCRYWITSHFLYVNSSNSILSVRCGQILIEASFFFRTNWRKNMYSSAYGPSAAVASGGMRGYRESNGGIGPYAYRSSASIDTGFGGGVGPPRRYPRSEFPPTRYRPPLPTYTMQSVSRSSSYGNSANHNKSSNEGPRSHHQMNHRCTMFSW